MASSLSRMLVVKADGSSIQVPCYPPDQQRQHPFAPIKSYIMSSVKSPITTSKYSQTVVTDLTINFESISPLCSSSTLETTNWFRTGNDLYLHALPEQSAWLHVAKAKEEELTISDLVVTDIRIGEPPSTTDVKGTWKSRPAGLWVLRSKYTHDIQQVVTGIDVLFGVDAVDPRPQWSLLREPFQLKNAPLGIPIARPTIRRGRPEGSSERPILRPREDGIFKIVQISDTHMVTGVGTCKDAIDADGRHLPESEADPLTVQFMEAILDDEKPDLVILTGDQLHHDIVDSQTVMFKVVAPMINRCIPWAAVFGNHDSEGDFALSRPSQMALYREMPFSLCDSGPEEIHGVGNYYLQVLDRTPSTTALATLYLLDSHGQINTDTKSPDYEAIQPSQIDWFTNTSRSLKNDREKSISQQQSKHHNLPHISLVFFHIPIPEFADDNHLAKIGGQRREPTEGPSMNTHFHKALVEEGVAAVGCGHDHVNDFCARVKSGAREPQDGPWLCYNGGSGFGGYSSYGENRYHRRTRVWEMNNHRGELMTWKRVEYHDQRVDELVLVAGCATVFPDSAANANSMSKQSTT